MRKMIEEKRRDWQRKGNSEVEERKRDNEDDRWNTSRSNMTTRHLSNQLLEGIMCFTRVKECRWSTRSVVCGVSCVGVGDVVLECCRRGVACLLLCGGLLSLRCRLCQCCRR